MGLCLVFAVLGIYCLLSTLRSRIVLFPDRIQVEQLSRTEVLDREDLRGWRSLPTSPPGLVLVPRDARRRPVKVAQLFRLDTEFAHWLDTLPRLDSADLRRSKAEIRNNARLGATPRERMQKLAESKRLEKVLAVIGSLVAAWGLLYPRPYELAIVALASLPWIALEIVRRSGGLFRVDAKRNDAHPNVAVAFMFPGLVLGSRSLLDYNVFLSPVAAWFTIGIGGLVFLAAFVVDRSVRGKVGTLIGLLVFSLAYGYGIAIEANALLDRSTGVTYVANVEGKHIVSGRATTYNLDLGPWGPKTKSSKLRVNRATYRNIERGDIVYLTMRRGALGVNWYFMRQWEIGSRTRLNPAASAIRNRLACNCSAKPGHHLGHCSLPGRY